MAKEYLIQAVIDALESARKDGAIGISQIPTVDVEVPRNKEHGDFSCTIALSLAKEAGLPPRKIAETLTEYIETGNGVIERMEVAGPGFINFYLKPTWLHDIVRDIDEKGSDYGRSKVGAGVKVLLEYVSANPNGPVTVASARGGVVGDTLARLYALTGAEVGREYYVNDAANSTQMINFAKSVVVRYQQLNGLDIAFPEDGYHGEYVTDIARDILQEHGTVFLEMDESERLHRFKEISEDAMIERQRQDLKDFGIEFDNWFRESSLFPGAVESTLAKLKERGYTYEKDGAVWLRSTNFGDDKDRALVRSNKQPTYIAADSAYHAAKFERGYNKLINVWGADHHGYVPRTKAAIAALGYNPDALDVIIIQTVRLFSGGELVMMSKRAGDVISLRELMDEVGVDATRYFLLMRSHDSPLDFDLELAKSQSDENPVFYVQYAHARIASVLRTAEERDYRVRKASECNLSLLTDEAEIDLMKKLADWPDEIATAAFLHEPHRLTSFATDLARIFHKFYTDCRVLGDDKDLSEARLCLVKASKTVLSNLLHTIGVSAPERM